MKAEEEVVKNGKELEREAKLEKVTREKAQQVMEENKKVGADKMTERAEDGSRLLYRIIRY